MVYFKNRSKIHKWFSRCIPKVSSVQHYLPLICSRCAKLNTFLQNAVDVNQEWAQLPCCYHGPFYVDTLSGSACALSVSEMILIII